MFNFQLDAVAALDNNFGGKGFQTGVEKAKILNVFITKSTGGNNTVDIELENERGGRAFIFGLKTDQQTAKGEKNYDYAKFMEFALAAGVRTGTIGKGMRKLNNVNQEVDTLAEAKGKTVYVALQKVFGVNNRTNHETENWALVKTFMADGLSVKEANEGLPAKEKDAFTVKDYYTKEWITADENGTLIKDNGNKPGSTEAATPSADAAPAAGSGKLF